jgi:hypothetical protein
MVRQGRDVLVDEQDPVVGEKGEVLHPYLGWVLNPNAHPGVTTSDGHFPVNRHGLLDTAEPTQRRSDDRVIVGIVGGSVAWFVSADAGRELIAELQQLPRFRGREIVLVRLALSGYKQPQQLLLVTYLLSLGAQFDIVVNIDGYNEVTLYPEENARFGMSPTFPRAWQARLEDRPDPRVASARDRFQAVKVRRRAWARWCNRLPAQGSYMVNLVWKSLDNRYAASMREDLKSVVQQPLRDPSYEVTGPPQSFASRNEMYAALVDYWQRCSIQLDRLCRLHDIEYHHVLPPNQYLEGSKPIGAAEHEVAIWDGAYAEHAQKAYPLLVQRGSELVRQHVRFHDLSMLFAARPEPIYVDNCCHYNHAGNVLVARAIAAAVGRSAPDTSPPP